MRLCSASNACFVTTLFVDPNSSIATELADEDDVIEKDYDLDITDDGDIAQKQSARAWDEEWLILEDGNDIDV